MAYVGDRCVVSVEFIRYKFLSADRRGFQKWHPILENCRNLLILWYIMDQKSGNKIGWSFGGQSGIDDKSYMNLEFCAPYKSAECRSRNKLQMEFEDIEPTTPNRLRVLFFW